VTEPPGNGFRGSFFWGGDGGAAARWQIDFGLEKTRIQLAENSEYSAKSLLEWMAEKRSPGRKELTGKVGRWFNYSAAQSIVLAFAPTPPAPQTEPEPWIFPHHLQETANAR
jgi:hypothetical protein